MLRSLHNSAVSQAQILGLLGRTRYSTDIEVEALSQTALKEIPEASGPKRGPSQAPSEVMPVMYLPSLRERRQSASYQIMKLEGFHICDTYWDTNSGRRRLS